LELAGDTHEHLSGFVEVRMLAGERDRGLTSSASSILSNPGGA
jgi:hypothetical protein